MIEMLSPSAWIAMAGCLIVGLSSYISALSNAKNRIAKTSALISVVGAILTAASSFWASYEGTKYSTLADKQRQKIEALNEKIVKQSEVITQISSLTYKTLTGYDGFIRLAGMLANHPCKVGAVFENDSKFPLYNVKVTVADLNLLDARKLDEFQHLIDIGDLSSRQDHIEDTPFIDTCNNQNKTIRLNLFYTARNGYFTQEYRVIHLNGATGIASRVVRNGLVIFQDVNSHYPRLSNGEPDWNLDQLTD